MFDNLMRLWRDARPGARLGLVFGVMLIAAALGWALNLTLKRDDQVLFADLDAQDAAAIVAELDRMKLPYRLGADGTTILVDSSQVHATRMKLMGKGVNLRGGVGFEIFANNDFGTTDFAQRINYQRALQGELTRTIAALEEVRQVRVHLVLPESGLFRKSGVKPKAAVTLALKRGRGLAAQQVLGIQRLVAAAVPEIEVGAVTIVDDHGVTLSRPADAAGEWGSEGRVVAKSEIEQYITRKAMAVIDRAFGPGRAIVTVDVALDDRQVKMTREDVLPLNERTGEGALTRKRSNSSGKGSSAAAADDGRAEGASSELEFQHGRRVEQVVSRPGGVTKIAVGILLPQALTADRAAELRRLIAATVGLNTARGDELAIASLDRFGGESAAMAASAPAPLVEVVMPPTRPAPAAANVLEPFWWLVLLGIAVPAALFAAARRPRTAGLSAAARDDMLRRVRQWMADDPAAAPETRA